MSSVLIFNTKTKRFGGSAYVHPGTGPAIGSISNNNKLSYLTGARNRSNKIY
jgi:hypothetical protein